MKAVYYARVSTDEEKQVNALSKQIKECEHCVTTKGWELVDSYIDEGKSGTTSNKRDEYKRLFNDLETDKFDVIVIKSQDRLMRNVRDWYIFIDRMVKSNKKLFFYIENKFYQSDDALITGIKAILAEEYSRELSKKINNFNKRRQATASSIITNGKLWGYNQKDGELTINEEEARVVRRIFELYIGGLGCRGIRKQLTKEGILTRNSTEFAETTIKRMIKNEKYKGTVIFNKTHKDFDTKKIVNNPPEEWIVHENRIPAIIDENTWNEANRIMGERARTFNTSERIDKKVGYNKAKHPLGGKIICSECGNVYYRNRMRVSNKDKTYKYIWRCATFVQKGRLHPWHRTEKIENWGGCDGINIYDDELNKLMSDIASNFSLDISHIIDTMMIYLEQMYKEENTTLDTDDYQSKIDKINSQKSFLLDKYMSGIVSDSDYTKKNNELDLKIDKLQEQIDYINSCKESRESTKDKLQVIKSELENGLVEEEKVTFIMNRIKQIKVYKDHLDIELDLIGNVVAEVNGKYLNVINSGQNRPHLDKKYQIKVNRNTMIPVFLTIK